MANYDNTLYTYADVLNNKGYYMKDDLLRYSAGVKTMQQKLNKAGFWCGTPDGKFGSGTDEAVRHFQRAYNLYVDGKAGYGTLAILDSASANSPGFTATGGDYSIYFDFTNKKFMYNQQRVYEALRMLKLNKIAIAGFMGNLEAEHQFRTALSGTGGAIGLAQWEGTRKANLQRYATANSMDITNIILQSSFIYEECTAGSGYTDGQAKQCADYLTNGNTVTTVAKAADYVTALYERCYYCTTWSAAQKSSYGIKRFDVQPNAYNSYYYLDTPKRRGYAATYYKYLCQM